MRRRSPCFDVTDEKECNELDSCEWRNDRCLRKKSPRRYIHPGVGKFNLPKDVQWHISGFYEPTLFALYQQDPNELFRRLGSGEYDEYKFAALLSVIPREDVLFLLNYTGFLDDSRTGFLQLSKLQNLFIKVVENQDLSVLEGLYNLNLIQFNWYFIQRLLTPAIFAGNIPLVYKIVELATRASEDPDYLVDVWNTALTDAGQTGNMDMVNLFIGLGASDYSSALFGAALGNQPEFMRRLDEIVDFTRRDLNNVFESCAELGRCNQQIYELLIELGADNVEHVLLQAVWHGDLDLAELMLENDADNIDEALIIAQQEGDQEMINLLQEWQ